MHHETPYPTLAGVIILALFLTFAFSAFAQPAESPVPPGGVTEGTLNALDKDGNPLGSCPLEHTDVNVDISGFIARVNLTQRFGNPFPDPIEAVYTFPMSDRAAVDRMTMQIGDRIIKGVVKERDEARRIYEAARRAGQAASLLDQERPNIFTQSVANILPGNRIDITISYVEYLQYEDGEYAFSFPMVVGPRYIPGYPILNTAPGTNQVPDAGRITPPVTPEGTRAGHDIAVTVAVDAGVPIQNVRSELHAVDIEQPAPSKAVVRLKNQQEIPNRDFILRYAVAGKTIGDAVLTHNIGKEGFFTLVLYPPDRVRPEEATPKEMIFVIDCSGSMRGFPIEKAKKTMRLCIEQMNPKDTFNLISFAGGTGYCFERPVPNTPENRRQALDYLQQLEGSGGTEMMGAIRAALEGPYDDLHLRVVCFMTDGFIGNDMDILGEVKKTAGTSRVFSFGIGNSVNRFLIEQMARMGRGAAEIVSLESQSDEAAERFFERIHSPVLTNITVDFGGLAIDQVYPDPAALPDLFSAQPVILTGRYTAPGAGNIVLRGRTSSGAFERSIPVALPELAPERDVLAPLWARANIDTLMAEDWQGLQQGGTNPEIKAKITQLGLEFSLVTQFTSFVAVEEKIINENGETRRVEVPVEMPDGVSYEGIYGDGMVMQKAAGVAMPSMRNISNGTGYPAADRLSVVHEAVAPQRVRLEPEKPPSSELSTPPPANPKLHAALQGLQAKVVNGNYHSDEISVENGWVSVFIRAKEITEEHLNELRGLGVNVVSTARSSNRILAKIRVESLEKVANLTWIERIDPPKF